jgi:hypothetical protein
VTAPSLFLAPSSSSGLSGQSPCAKIAFTLNFSKGRFDRVDFATKLKAQNR